MTHLPQSITCPRCSSVNPGEANFCRRCGIGIHRPALAPAAIIRPTPVKAKKSNYAFWPFLVVAVFVLRVLNLQHYKAPPPATPQLRYSVPPTRTMPPLPTYSPGRPIQDYNWNHSSYRTSPHSSDNPWHLENRNGSGSRSTGY